MDPSGIHNFEEEWRKALSDASETPPRSVWDNIEARLDEKDTIIPLWWQSKKLWLAAAAVAALLVVGAGFWINTNQKGSISGSQVANSAKPTQSAVEKAEEPSISSSNKENEQLAAASEQTQAKTIQTDSEAAYNATSSVENNASSRRSTSRLTIGNQFAGRTLHKSRKRAGNDTQIPTVSAQSRDNTETSAALAVNALQPASGNAADAVNTSATSSPDILNANLLTSLNYKELDVHVQKRYVFFKPEVLKEEEAISPKKHTEYWAGVGIMPASFNPDITLKQTPEAFSYQTLSNKRATSGTSESGISYALQTQGGVRFSKHWSMELGLSYLQGNSTYQGGGYLMNAYSQSANVLENALADASARPSYAASKDFQNGAVYIDVAKKVSNNYQYLQMPVQAGFTLNPDKRLSYSLLGGMMANFFLSNDLESASGEIITTTASDEVYRSMNWAATTGLRFNYRVSGQWKATLTGSYQKSVSSGLRSNQTLDAHPYLYGVSWGVRYSF